MTLMLNLALCYVGSSNGMLATTHIILLGFGIFLMCGTWIPDCTQLMLQNQLCATLVCFPPLCCNFIDALKHLFPPDIFKADVLVRCGPSISTRVSSSAL